MKLDPEEVALFDAILAGVATEAPLSGDDEQLAKDAAKRGRAFVAERRNTIPNAPGGDA